MQATSTPILKCDGCSETFLRPEHLRRHISTHVDNKPHICPICYSRYKRSDTLRRHWKTCAERLALGSQIPKRSLSGKRRKACDRCASSKRACSTARPCAECFSQGAECTYSRGQKLQSGSRISSAQGGSETPLAGGSIDSENFIHSRLFSRQRASPDSDELNLHAYSPRFPQTRFDFLLNFTKATELNKAYNYSPDNKLSFLNDENFNNTGVSESSASDDVATAWNPFDCYSDEVEAILRGGPGKSPSIPSYLPPEDYSGTGIAEKASQLLDALHPILQSPTFSHCRLSSAMITEFFSPTNLVRYLDLFWTRWHQHCPIVHKATFSLRNCSNLILVTMSLIGACMSPQEADHHGAKRVLDIVEELIFSSPLFSERAFPRARGDNPLQTRHNVQTLQATCFMCLLQKWEGSKAAKLRTQRHRFTALVAVTRAMGIYQAIHPPRSMRARFEIDDWRDYILKEEMIRTFNYVFLLDCAFVIFHNSVPRMVLQEMTINLTCPEDMFQASSPENFFIAVQSHPSRLSPPLLTDCVRSLCAESPDADIIAYLHIGSALNLFTIATAIHSLIFHQLRAFSPLPLATDPLKKALDRWEEAWSSSTKQLSHSDRLNLSDQQDSFPHRAREFALLARIHVERSYLSAEGWNTTVENLSEQVLKECNEGLATFDQTDMDQVAKLILQVEQIDVK